MRSLRTVLQVSTYATLTLSALILAHAEGATFPQGLTVPLALVAWTFNERLGLLRLPTWGANLLGMLGFLAAMTELLSNTLESRLLAGAHLLVYLSWVVLFQAKKDRQYLWMAALSMLQVAVGSVLTSAETYGGLVVVYFCCAVWTLSLLTLWQSHERTEIGKPVGPVSDPVTPSGAFSALTAPGSVRHGVQREGPAGVSLWRFGRGALATSIGCLLVAVAFFGLIPRVWVGAPTFGAEAGPRGPMNVTGYSGEVTLGDMGRILESNEPVLSVTLIDAETSMPVSVESYSERMGWDEPLFRGAVLVEYARGQWKPRRSGASPVSLFPAPPLTAKRLRQQVTLMPIRTNVLFAMPPVAECAVPGGSPVISPATGVIVHPDNRGRRSFSYTAFVPHPDDKSVLGYVPLSVIARQRPHVAREIRNDCLQIPPRLERLAAEARRVSGLVGGADRPSDRELVDRIVSHLRDSGRFTYSLDASVRNADLDPIEDFLIERRQGHCEYFASALALMLRAIDIPTRLVSGFKGGKLNTITGAFDVEQRHAHAWVEAYVDDRWIMLDATPSAPRDEVVDALDPNVPQFHDLLTFFRDLWNTHVLNLSIGHQNDRIYNPMKAAATSVWRSIRGDRQARDGLFASIRRFLSSPEEWFSWRGGLAALILGFLGCCVHWTGRRLLGWIRRLAESASESRADDERTIEFYERFRRLCAQIGLERDPAQTHREFGAQVEAAWRRRDGETPPADAAPFAADRPDGAVRPDDEASRAPALVPVWLAELFYRVRFGDRGLTEEEAADVGQALDRIERDLAMTGTDDA